MWKSKIHESHKDVGHVNRITIEFKGSLHLYCGKLEAGNGK